jgi:hypothetical protein
MLKAGDRGVATSDAQQLGGAKVQQFHIAIGSDENIRRLQIAMHHAPAVRELHRSADSQKKAQAILYSQTPLVYQLAITVPNLADGDYPVVATIRGVSSPVTTFLTIKH